MGERRPRKRDKVSKRKKHLRWIEVVRKRHNSIANEEARKEEDLRIFGVIGKLSKGRIEDPYFHLRSRSGRELCP